MVTDPIQHVRAKGDRRRRRSRRRIVRGASYSKCDTLGVTWSSSPERHGAGAVDNWSGPFTVENVGFRLSLTLPCNVDAGVAQ